MKSSRRTPSLFHLEDLRPYLRPCFGLCFRAGLLASVLVLAPPPPANAIPAPTNLRGAIPSTAPTAAKDSASVSSSSSRTPGSTIHIMIDPGHGGVDKGAVRGHLKEAEIALKVSKKLAALLREDPRFKVTLTREADHAVTLFQRTQMAQNSKADLFVSIHLNSSTDPRAHGKEFYFQNQLPVDEELMFIASRENAENEGGASDADPRATQNKSEKLSNRNDLRRILDDLNRNERITASSELSQVLHETWMSWGAESGKTRRSGSRAIRQAPFYVVSNVHVPSVLVELGFLSNPQEGPRLAQDEYQSELAKSLYSGLVKFKETMDKDRPGNLNSANAN